MDRLSTLDPNIVPTRLGHYQSPDYEQVALVVDVDRMAETVNLVVWQKDGEPMRRLNVPITGSLVGEAEGASFHLVSSCPFRG